MVPVRYGNQQNNLPALVVKGQGPNLIGQDWLHVIKLNWALIFQKNECHPCSELMEVLETHKEVFTKELGTLQGITANIYANQDAQPKFVKAQPVPLAMKIPLEQELERLQQEGIISPVEFSDWASPIATVAKPANQMGRSAYVVITKQQLTKPRN